MRRGGWSWGPDPQRLIHVATAALPRLIDEALSHLLENVPTDLHIERLSVRLGPAAAAVVDNPLGPPSPAAVDALRAAIVRQLRPQLPHVASTVVEHPAEVLRTPELLPEIEPCDFARVIVGWCKDGSLQARLAWFSLPALQAWESALLDGLPQQSRDDLDIVYELPVSLHALMAKPLAEGDRPRALLLLRLVLAAELLTAHAGNVPASDLHRLLERVLPAPPVIPSSSGTARADAPGLPPPRDDQLLDPPGGPQHPADVPKAHPMIRPSSIRGASSPIDTRVCSALPFLVLGILHRMGYLRTLSAALAVADATPLAAAYASALAYKLLRAPESGWRRDPESLHAAATFAGLTAPLEEKTLRTFERQAGTHLTPLDGDIVASLRAGYDARNPLLVQRVDRVYLCFDTLGMFPVAFAADCGEIASLLTSFAPAVVFADAATISSPLIECLERNSCAFVTDAQPGRGDQWRSLDRRRQHWTGGSRPASAALRGRYLSEHGGRPPVRRTLHP